MARRVPVRASSVDPRAGKIGAAFCRLCPAGSQEYVKFFASTDDGATWTDLGLTAITIDAGRIWVWGIGSWLGSEVPMYLAISGSENTFFSIT